MYNIKTSILLVVVGSLVACAAPPQAPVVPKTKDVILSVDFKKFDEEFTKAYENKVFFSSTGVAGNTFPVEIRNVSSTMQIIPFIHVKINGVAYPENLEVYLGDQKIYGPQSLLKDGVEIMSQIALMPNEAKMLLFKTKESLSQDVQVTLTNYDIVDNVTGVLERVQNPQPIYMAKK